MNKSLFIATAISCMASAAVAQSPLVEDDIVAKIIEEGTSNNRVMYYLDVLTNRFGGRPIGSDAYDNAGDWLIYEFNKMGIKAHKEEAGQVPVGFNRGPWSGRLNAGEDGMTLHFATPSYTSGTHGVERGHVVREPRTEREFQRMKHRLNGAWVLLSGKSQGWPINRTAKGDSIREAVKKENQAIAQKNDSLMKRNWEMGEHNEMLPYKNEPGLFYKEMRDAGALGYIRSASLPIRALYDRPMINEGTITFDSLSWQPDILLDEKQFAVIEQMVKDRRDIELEFDIRNHFKLGPVKYHNIVAEIPGTEYPDEYVLVTGHLDSYDVASGAVDCGTGIGPMMEAARLLAKSGAKPKRTIRFVAFAGEEFGLLGAKAYCERHKDELSKISMVLNRDGGPLPPVSVNIPESMKGDFEQVGALIRQIDAEYPFEVNVVPPRVQPTTGGSTDATVFEIYGVPAQGFRDRDTKGYDFQYGEIWHTENDYYNKEIPEYQQYAAKCIALGALGVANLDHQLSREGMFKPAEEKATQSKKSKRSKKGRN
ncbi:MAG: M20/M25/M40 family metallo-hydrolase [Muribaculaceae bacterium]|nr:M20/M25/M40 family metallo-hydrolase [Muribaculaceae bacterium]